MISSRIIKNDLLFDQENITANLIFTCSQMRLSNKNCYTNLYKFDLNTNEKSKQKIWICKEFKEVIKCY